MMATKLVYEQMFPRVEISSHTYGRDDYLRMITYMSFVYMIQSVPYRLGI